MTPPSVLLPPPNGKAFEVCVAVDVMTFVATRPASRIAVPAELFASIKCPAVKPDPGETTFPEPPDTALNTPPGQVIVLLSHSAAPKEDADAKGSTPGESKPPLAAGINDPVPVTPNGMLDVRVVGLPAILSCPATKPDIPPPPPPRSN